MLRGTVRAALLAFPLLLACGAEPPGPGGDRTATVRAEAVAIANQRTVVPTSTAAPSQTATAAPASPTPGPAANPPPVTPIADPSAARPPLPPPPTVSPTATPHPGYPGQSNLVPPGYPTPATASERLVSGGPPRHPGALVWARPGPYLGAAFDREQVQSFRGDARLATTYYFYWHDLTDPARRARFAERFNLPPIPDRYHFLFPDTHYREFADMRAAGLNFVSPVYWGEPGHPGRTTGPTSPHYWSTEGIPPTVEALDRLAGEGNALKLGLFYDTTILANADLRTEVGRKYFYINVRDFYSRIPPRHWAAIDGRPVVWLYDTLWVASFDQETLDYLTRRFGADFGGLQPYVVAESQWEFAKHAGDTARLRVDGLYGGGGRRAVRVQCRRALHRRLCRSGIQEPPVLPGRRGSELLRHRPGGRSSVRAPAPAGGREWTPHHRGRDVERVLVGHGDCRDPTRWTPLHRVDPTVPRSLKG